MQPSVADQVESKSVGKIKADSYLSASVTCPRSIEDNWPDKSSLIQDCVIPTAIWDFD